MGEIEEDTVTFYHSKIGGSEDEEYRNVAVTFPWNLYEKSFHYCTCDSDVVNCCQGICVVYKDIDTRTLAVQMCEVPKHSWET